MAKQSKQLHHLWLGEVNNDVGSVTTIHQDVALLSSNPHRTVLQFACSGTLPSSTLRVTRLRRGLKQAQYFTLYIKQYYMLRCHSLGPAIHTATVIQRQEAAADLLLQGPVSTAVHNPGCMY